MFNYRCDRRRVHHGDHISSRCAGVYWCSTSELVCHHRSVSNCARVELWWKGHALCCHALRWDLRWDLRNESITNGLII